MATGAVVARIITQYSNKGSKAAKKDIANLGKSFDDFSKKTVRAFAVATAAVGAFAVKVGKDAVQAAMADQKSQALLANSLRNTTGATNAAIASVESYVSNLQLQVGVTDDELRPSLAKLAAVTGSVAAAQQLLSTALDVSAFAGVDLGTATTAVTRALQGNFRSLQKLVPSIDATAIKSKNLAAVFKEVEKATSGSASTRANTLEYRLAILRIRYSEILETLGYALLPVLEEFSKVLTSDILPKIARWIELNKKGLADGLRNAASAALELLKAAIQIGAWVVANFNTIKNFGILLASIWATGRVYAFVTAIGKVALAFQGMQAAAAGAAIASNAATGSNVAGLLARGGALATGARVLGVAALPLAAIGAAGFAVRRAGDGVRANRAKVEGALAGYSGSPGPSDLATIRASGSVASRITAEEQYLAFLNKLDKMQNKLNSGKKKELSLEQKILNRTLRRFGLSAMTPEGEARATAMAIKLNLERQGANASAVAASPTVSLASQGDGSANGGPGTIAGSRGGSLIEVKVELPFGMEQEYITKVNDGSRILNRRGGGGTGRVGTAQVM